MKDWFKFSIYPPLSIAADSDKYDFLRRSPDVTEEEVSQYIFIMNEHFKTKRKMTRRVNVHFSINN